MIYRINAVYKGEQKIMKKKLLLIVMIIALTVTAGILFAACGFLDGGNGGDTTPPGPTVVAAPTNVVFNEGSSGRFYVSWTEVTAPANLLGGIMYRVYADGVFLNESRLSSLNISDRIFESEDPDIVFTVVAIPAIPSANFERSVPSEPATLTRTALAAPTNIRILTTNITWTNPSAVTSIHPSRIYANGVFLMEQTSSIIGISALGLEPGEHEITVSLAARGRHLASPHSVPFTLTIS